MITTKTVVAALLAAGMLAAAAVVLAQGGGHQHAAPPAGGHQHGAEPDGAKPASPPPAGRVVQSEELHRGGGVPRGWKFTLPAGGDPARGRTLFADLECYKCHVIKDAGFPPLGADGKKGPELTGMGRFHPAEYFAESILDPSAVIVDGPGHIDPDGRSIMPGFADSLSVKQLLDLVAFLKSQDTGGEEVHGGSESQERTVGPYRVRLTFEAAGAHDHAMVDGHGAAPGAPPAATPAAHHAHQHQHAADKPAARAGRLTVFVTDAVTGEPVPYLPVSAGLHAKGAPSRTVRLTPMLGARGVHYGADVALPAGTQRIVLTIGATTMRVIGADRERFARRHTVAFDWNAAPR